MKVVALVSGGKDSCYSMHLCQVHGHQVVALANLVPPDTSTDELDSYMYQTVGHQLVAAYAACTGLPLYRRKISGHSNSQALSYEPTKGDEVEDLHLLLAYIRAQHPDIQAVASGAIASDYQRTRVESVCSRLGLVSLAYLWHQPQDQLLSNMIINNIEAILVKVAAIGLDPHKHLGKSIRQLQPYLRQLKDKFGCNVCGEGGEYETLTLDCPAFKHGRIILDNWQVVLHSPDSIASVGVLHPAAFHIEPKEQHLASSASDSNMYGQQAGPIAAADVVQVPADWQPTSKTLSVKNGGQQNSADSNSNWQVELVSTLSEQHVHITCSVSNQKTSSAEQGGKGAAFGAADTTAALDAVLSDVTASLVRLGISWSCSIFVHLYLADMAQFAAANEVYCQFLPQVNPPSRACVQVPLPAGCPLKLDVLFARSSSADISAAAAPIASLAEQQQCQEQQQHQQQLHLSDDQQHYSQQPSPYNWPERRVLHVQSISSWAPSCIGPYSQATACTGLVYLAGQIPLDPASMAIISPLRSPTDVPHSIVAQVWRTLRSCQAVAVAMRSCMATASLALTVYLSEACAAAGGQQLVQAALEAVWHDRSLLDSSELPAALTAAHVLGGPAAEVQGADLMVGSNRLAARSSAAAIKEDPGSSDAASDVVESNFFEAEGQNGLVVDDYLLPPAVHSPLQPAVVYVTVPALPRGALLEVQPVLVDLAAASNQASSSSSSNDEQANIRVCSSQGVARYEPEAGACAGSYAADASVSGTGQDAAAASGVYVHSCWCTGASHSSNSSRWQQLLVHLAREPAAEAVASAQYGQAVQATSAAQQATAAVFSLQQQAGRPNGHSLAACCRVVSVRCWYTQAIAADVASWGKAVLDSLQTALCVHEIAVQFVPVKAVASVVQPWQCWAILEAFVL